MTEQGITDPRVLSAELATVREERDAARAALEKATYVLERTTELFHPNYLLYADALLKECKAALGRGEGGEGGAG